MKYNLIAFFILMTSAQAGENPTDKQGENCHASATETDPDRTIQSTGTYVVRRKADETVVPPVVVPVVQPDTVEKSLPRQ